MYIKRLVVFFALLGNQPPTGYPTITGAEAVSALTRNSEKSTTVIHFLLCLRLDDLEGSI